MTLRVITNIAPITTAGSIEPLFIKTAIISTKNTVIEADNLN